MRATLAVLALAACSGADREAAPARCDPPTLPHRDFRSKITPRLGDARHAVNDVITAIGAPFEIRAKLSYGKLLKDLEDDAVGLIVGDGECGPWAPPQAALTDDDGWARFDQAALELATVRPFHVIVAGDGSRVGGRIWAVAPGTAAVLFDIDGTLTTSDAELFEDLLGGDAPEMRPGADAVARRWAELGYLVVYITGRPYPLRPSTLQWLDDRGFPPGPVMTPEAFRNALPTQDNVGAWKRALIAGFLDAGLVFEAAYGNASTDVCAYANAGIDPARTWITQRREPCGAHPAPHDLPSYVDHLPTLRDHPRASE